MTNFQSQDSPRFGLTPERLLQLAPLVLALLLSALLGGAWLLPLMRQLSGLAAQRGELEAQRDALAANQARLARAQLQLLQARTDQGRLLQLVAGTDQLDTLLAQLAMEAAAAGVTLDSFEPQASAAAAETPPRSRRNSRDRDQTKDTPPADPLLVDGLQKRSQLVLASGSFPQLLTFLRRLEVLSPLAVVSDLNLTHPAPAGGSDVQEPTVLKFTLTAYSRGTTEDPAPSPSGRKEPAA